MGEDFQPNYWWNNSASGSGFGRSNQPNTSPSSSSISCSTTITDAGGAAFSWPSTAGISESKPSILCDNQIDPSHTPGFGLISTLYTDWNQTLAAKAECSFHSMLHDHDRGTNQFSRRDLGESSSTIPFKDSNFTSSSSSPSTSVYSSSMLQGLIQPGSSRFQLPCLDNQDKNHEYQSQTMALHGVSNETQQLSWKQFADNYTPFWNASAAGFYPSPLSPSITQLSASKSGCNTKTNTNLGGDWAKRGNREPEQKKTRVGTALPMPDITVMRKEKLRDRVTALQQLVSPFGKTDTASVLQEAIEYIKFLHDQVSVLCAPYFKTGRPMQQNQNSENKSVKAKDGEDRPDVLRSRGLCLVPMESIYSADSDNITAASEFWTPIHGRTYW